MNKFKSKENLHPNNHQKCQRGIETTDGVKTRNQAKKLFKEIAINHNPQKCTSKTDVAKPHGKLKVQKQTIKVQKKPQKPIPEQFHYEKEILTYVNSQTTEKFKKNKHIKQNTEYKKYRTGLLQSIYKECISFHLKQETFYLYVYFLDSFMKTDAGKNISTQSTIMASYACFLMAQKYEQIYPPSISQWLPQSLHQDVYRWQGKVIFALGFKFIHESIFNFFEYWALKLELKKEEIESCKLLMLSIVFNYDLYYRYEPQKISKAIVMLQVANDKKKKKILASDPYHILQSVQQKNVLANDLKSHINKYGEMISWLANVR